MLFSCLERSVEEVLTADHSARVVGTGRLLIVRSMNNITGPTDTRTEPGYKLNCARQGEVGKFHGAIQIFARALTTQLC